MTMDIASVMGKRSSNEDTHFINCNINGDDKSKSFVNIYAVFDGHGGSFVSKYLAKELPLCFMNKKVEYPLKKTFVKKVYKYYQDKLIEKYYSKSLETGAAALMVFHYMNGSNKYLDILNVGDSRCIVCRNIYAKQLTMDHKPNAPEEKMRIESLGGKIVFDGFDYRVCDLSLSRAFGDISAHPYVTCNPSQYAYKLNANDRFMVIGCDGLYESLDNQEIIDFVLLSCYDIKTGKRNGNNKVANKLAKYAIAKGSGDNITVIVVFFDDDLQH